MQGHAHCVQFLRQKNIPLILLGGGGYTVKNVARTWAYETACALGVEDTINPDMPWNQYFEWFGPKYRLEVVQSNMDDLNIQDGSLEEVKYVVFCFHPRQPPNMYNAGGLPLNIFGSFLLRLRLGCTKFRERGLIITSV